MQNFETMNFSSCIAICFLYYRGKDWFDLIWLSNESCCELSDLIQFSGHVQCYSFLKERSIRTSIKNALKELKNCQIFTADVWVPVSCYQRSVLIRNVEVDRSRIIELCFGYFNFK